MGNEKADDCGHDRVLREYRHLLRIVRLERDEAQGTAASVNATLDLDREAALKVEKHGEDLATDVSMAREFARDMWQRARTADVRGRALALFNRFSRTLGLGFSERLEEVRPDVKLTLDTKGMEATLKNAAQAIRALEHGRDQRRPKKKRTHRMVRLAQRLVRQGKAPRGLQGKLTHLLKLNAKAPGTAKKGGR